MLMDFGDFDEKTFAAGFYPFQMMIRAPLGTFPFRYLLTEDDAERVAKNLEEYTASPFEDKVVAHAIQESLCTEHTFFQRALNLMKSIFCAQDSTEERAECERSTVRTTGKCTPTSFEQFFTIERLSNLAGMILLNGQEREPPSSYAAYISWMREDSDRGTQMNMFHTQLRNENIVIRNLKKGMHGQAVYRIASCFNHSCDPNVVIEYNELKNGLGIIAKAARKVEEFEELTISYIDENLSYPLRQLQLFDHYKFMCQCAKCQREHSLWKPHQVVRNVKSSAVHV